MRGLAEDSIGLGDSSAHEIPPSFIACERISRLCSLSELHASIHSHTLSLFTPPQAHCYSESDKQRSPHLCSEACRDEWGQGQGLFSMPSVWL